MASNPIFAGSIVSTSVQILPADTTTAKILVTAGALGTRVDTLAITSTDTAPQILTLIVNNGASDFIVGTISVPALAGTTGSAAPVSGLQPLLMPWLPTSGAIFLKPSATLKIASLTTVTAAKAINVTTFGGDY